MAKKKRKKPNAAKPKPEKFQRPPEPMDIDQKIRINELREEIREVTGGKFSEGESNAPPEIREQFLKQVLEYEKAEFTTHYDKLVRDGLDFPPAEKLDDKALVKKLKEVIQRLAEWNVSLSHTNHLSDRELYQWLREEGLREEVPDMPYNPCYFYGLDVLGSYGEEDVNLYNKYYASKKDRRKHAKEYPEWPLPAHVDPPYDRDKTLPQPKIPHMSDDMLEELTGDDEPDDKH
jgi:hypothetical protein